MEFRNRGEKEMVKMLVVYQCVDCGVIFHAGEVIHTYKRAYGTVGTCPECGSEEYVKSNKKVIIYY